MRLNISQSSALGFNSASRDTGVHFASGPAAPWVAAPQAPLGEKGFRQEVLREFQGSGETYFPTSVLTTLSEQPPKIVQSVQKFSGEFERFFGITRP